MATSDQNKLLVGICARGDLARRFQAILQTREQELPVETTFLHKSLSEIKLFAREERPDILIVGMHQPFSISDSLWLRASLQDIRQRLSNSVRIILAVSAPEQFTVAGQLLLQSKPPWEGSGLIDDLVVPPPLGLPTIASFESQLIDAIRAAVELRATGHQENFIIPPLSDPNWAPAFADPQSRELWTRWLPRYARYTHENPLIVGPTGSGKTKLAQALHQLSNRTGPFVSITPRDFSSSELVQAELFGAVSGAYTGAVEKWGLVKKAEKGTLFIDELQSIDLELQGKLITFIESKVYRRVGEAESHRADVRFIFATNRTLNELVEAGKLRDDFAYRLERLQLTLPALSERKLDVAAALMLSLAKVQYERAHTGGQQITAEEADEKLITGVSAAAYRSLSAALWPGNLRQLENTVARILEFCKLEHKTCVSEELALQALQGILGTKAVTPVDVFQKALERIKLTLPSTENPSLSNLLIRVSEATRSVALELSAGDAEKAALLISDSKNAMELFSRSLGGRHEF